MDTYLPADIKEEEEDRAAWWINSFFYCRLYLPRYRACSLRILQGETSKL